jgi:tetratricopeptide (TPR) repeat protein
MKMLDKALESYKLAARHSGGDLLYLRKVADMQERMGQLGEASRTYMAAGELLLKQRNLDDAIANWERSVRLDPNLLGAHQRLAMVFQRQNNVKAAVREYLAITRILQMQGEKQKALAMCQAALRLDPGNPDVLLAVQLVQHGEAALPEEEPEEEEAPVPAEPAETLAHAVRQMAAVLEAETREAQLPTRKPEVTDPLELARRRAQEELAEEIFRDEEDEEAMYGTREGGLSKLERDALIGQGMDFQQRGRTDEAIRCYEKAIAGGLNLPGAFFALGLLYLERKQFDYARRALSLAARDHSYRDGIQTAVARFGQG